MPSADTLTVTLDRPDKDVEVTFTHVTYNLTWNRLSVRLLDTGTTEVFDRLDVVGYEAAKQHQPERKAGACSTSGS
jgi:hypothetical protein